MDLASLFCMIGRHGPAVALAVFAVVSVLAGIYIYRNVRRKRRKVVADEGVVSSAEEDRDASVIQRLRHSSGESTGKRAGYERVDAAYRCRDSAGWEYDLPVGKRAGRDTKRADNRE